MKSIPVEKSVGMVLCHDITRIVPGESKGPAFRKGHVVTEQDIATLLDIGKEHLYVYDLSEGYVHEDDAARRIAAAAAGDGLSLSDPQEGRVNMAAVHNGLLKVDVEALTALNSIEDVVFASVHSNQQVEEGRQIAGTRVVPLVVPEEVVLKAEAVCREAGGIARVLPFRRHRIGLITTGSEIYKGRIKDRFGPVLERKFGLLGSEIVRQEFVSDDIEMTVKAIRGFQDEGVDMIVITGGMSVDPDDQTPASIRAAGADIVTYGAPVLPGAMFMLGWLGDIPVTGLPGCVMYYRASIFDLVIPRLLAGDRVTKADIAAMGHGGFCAGCEECRYPVCPFGKYS